MLAEEKKLLVTLKKLEGQRQRVREYEVCVNGELGTCPPSLML